MSSPNVLASEKCPVVGTVDPATITTMSYTDAIDMSKFHQALGIALLGNMAAEDIIFAVYPCNSAGNARGTALKTKTLTGSAGGNDNAQIAMGFRAEELLGQATYTRYIQFGLSNAGGSGGPAGVVALGIDPKYGPGSDDDLSSVTIVNALD